MGVSIDFKYDYWIPDKFYTYKIEVEEDIEELEEEIEESKRELAILSAGNPKDLMPDEEYDIVHWLNERINDIVIEITKNSILLFKLRAFLEYLNENKVEAKIPKKLMGYIDE